MGAHALAGDGRPHSSTITVVCCFCWARSDGPAVCVRAGCAATATTYAQIKMLVDTNHRREALALNDLRAKRRRPRVGGRQAMTLIVALTALRQSTQNFPKISREIMHFCHGRRNPGETKISTKVARDLGAKMGETRNEIWVGPARNSCLIFFFLRGKQQN